MFTGIVTDIGTVTEVDLGNELTARIAAPQAASGLEPGASVSCDGICLTATRCEDENDQWFEVTASPETLTKTNVGSWKLGSRVNLERSLRVGDELGGHVVTGHVDDTAEVVSVVADGDCRHVCMRVPNHLSRFIASKGSVALNGVSLTVNDVGDTRFSVTLIPFTLSKTNLSGIGAGDKVNLEIDILARYVSRMRQTEA